MSKQRIIKDEIWDDTWFVQQDIEVKIVWIYLLTNPRCNVAGVYKLNRKVACISLGMELDVLNEVISGLQRDKKIVSEGDWIIIINFIKHQKDNPSIRAGIKRILSEAPKEVTDCLQTVHSLDTVSSTLLNFTLLNLTLPNGETPDDLFEEKKFSDKDMEMAQLLATRIKSNYPDWEMRGNIETWAEHVEKLHRLDRKSYEQIEFMIRWVQQDSFWRKNILSTAKLREKFNQLVPQCQEDMAKRQMQSQQANKPKFA